jgi:hypothetical protein
MVDNNPSAVLRVVPPRQLESALQRDAEAKVAAKQAALSDVAETELANYIRTQFEMMKIHRDNGEAGWSTRLMDAMRAFNGKYDATKLQEIRKFGGSEVYARIIAMKCRGASSLLRDVYLAPDRAWGLAGPADPDVPSEIQGAIQQLVEVEMSTLAEGGMPTDPAMIRDRVMQLMEAARNAAKKNATKRAKVAEERIDEILEEGNFYKALAEFIVDLPLFPFACIKGPVVRIVPSVSYNNGAPAVEQKPKLFWQRVSPFDLWWTPGASDIEDASVIERSRMTRAELNDLLDLPGYNHDGIREVLREYGEGGLSDDWDGTDATRAAMESRENPVFNQSGLINCLEFHGNVQGKMLKQYKIGKLEGEKIDELRDYFVQAWLIGRHIIKVQLSPSPRKRHPYFITSFEKVPGTPVGNGLPDILSDVQEVCNATLRTLVNNLSISSGPQVVINSDRLDANEDAENLYPWKRWYVTSDPMGSNSQVPISFFQPNSNAAELLGVYEKFNAIADELSAIPKYMSGNSVGGAGRTASGLAMLMGNASKILQTVAANIDRDVLDPLLHQLYDMLMLTDTSGMLQGDEEIRVMGVNVAVQRETQRARQLELLQITANPIDAAIMGPEGRSKLLRAVSTGVGIPGEDIVPSEEEAAQRQAAAQQQQMQQDGARSAQGNQAPQGGNVSGDMGPRTNISGGVQ